MGDFNNSILVMGDDSEKGGVIPLYGLCPWKKCNIPERDQ